MILWMADLERSWGVLGVWNLGFRQDMGLREEFEESREVVADKVRRV